MPGVKIFMNRLQTILNHRVFIAFVSAATFCGLQTLVVASTPTINCPSDIIVSTAAGGCLSVPVPFIAASSGDPQPTVRYFLGSTEIVSPYPFAVGTNTVSVTAVNGESPDANCSFRVVVMDVEAPLVTVPSNLVLQLGQSTNPANTGVATATDCSSYTIVSADGAPKQINASAQQGWFTSRSSGGGALTASASFVTNGPATPPLGDGCVRLAVGTNGATAGQLRTTNFNGVLLRNLTECSYYAYRTQDGTGGQAVYLILSVDINADGVEDDLLTFEPRYQVPTFNPNLPNQGPTQTGVWQRWNAGGGGWWSSNSVAGMVSGAGVKALSAYLAAYPNARLSTNAAGAFRVVAGFGVGAWNNFDGNVDAVTIGTNGVSTTYDFNGTSPTCPVKSTIARAWTATDSYGNLASSTQFITLKDTTPPVLICPGNIVTTNDPGLCGAVVNFSVTSSDAGGYVLTSSSSSGSIFPIGTTTVTNKAVDSCGNQTVCTFTVTVNDIQLPTITCPSDIAVVIETNELQSIVNFNVAATDNCAVSVVSTPPSGASFPVGTTIVNSVATDASGNTNRCSFSVVVNRRPTAGADTITTVENQVVAVFANALLGNDSDLDGDTLSLLSVSPVSTNGGFVIYHTTPLGRNLLYIPPTATYGADQFTYTLIDSRGATRTGIVNVTILPLGFPPQGRVSVSRGQTGLRVRYTGVPGQSYSIQKVDFLNGPWINMASPVAADGAGAVEIIDSESPLPMMRFYRAVAAP